MRAVGGKGLIGLAAGVALLLAVSARAEEPDSIVGGELLAPPAAEAPLFRPHAGLGHWVAASARLFDRKFRFSVSATPSAFWADALLHPYVRVGAPKSGLHRRLEAGLALPLGDTLSVATAYGRVRLRGPLPASDALRTHFAKVGLKLAF